MMVLPRTSPERSKRRSSEVLIVCRGGLPGITEGGLGDLARNTDRRVTKRELVILLKPTVIQSDANWEQDLRETRGRVERMTQ